MSATGRRRPPAALLVVAAVVALQGAGLLALSLAGITDVVPSRAEVGVSVSVFLGTYGAALLACAWALSRSQGWARGPVLLTELIQLGLAWNVRADPVIAAVLAVSALGALVAILQPASIAALLDGPDDAV